MQLKESEWTANECCLYRIGVLIEMSLLLVIINHAVTTNTKAPRWESQGYGGAGGTLWHWPTLVPHLHHGTWCPGLEVLLPAPTLPAGLVSGLSPGPHCCAAESTERMLRGLLERGGLKSGVQLVLIYCAFSAFFWSSMENGAAGRLPAVFFYHCCSQTWTWMWRQRFKRWTAVEHVTEAAKLKSASKPM